MVHVELALAQRVRDIVSSRRAYTYEFFLKTDAAATFYISFLKEMCDSYGDENNLSQISGSLLD